METTHLCFKVQMSPEQLTQVINCRTNLQKNFCYSNSKSLPIVNQEKSGIRSIIDDLTELIKNYKKSDYQFNPYILKLCILKIQETSQKIQVGYSSKSFDSYQILNSEKERIEQILSDLLEPA